MCLAFNKGGYCEYSYGHIAVNYVAISLAFNIAIAIAIFKAIDS